MYRGDALEHLSVCLACSGHIHTAAGHTPLVTVAHVLGMAPAQVVLAAVHALAALVSPSATDAAIAELADACPNTGAVLSAAQQQNAWAA